MATDVIPALPPGFEVDPPPPPGFQLDAPAAAAAPAAPKRQVGQVESALRTAAAATQPVVRLFDMAAAGLAGIFGDTGGQEQIFEGMKARQQGMSEMYAPGPNEEFATGGSIAGGVAAYPAELLGGLGIQHGMERASNVVEQGGTLEQARTAGAVTGGVRGALNLLPARLGGAVASRIGGGVARQALGGGITGAAVNVPAGAIGTAAENVALPGQEDASVLERAGGEGVDPQFQQLARDPLDTTDLATSTGLAAAFGAVGGGRAARTPKAPKAEAKPTPGTQASGGAAGTDMATIRRERAAALPVPIKTTKGQETRDFEQQRFEKETAKDADNGKRLRERADEQNKQVIENLEAFEDLTGREEPERGNAGRKIVDVVERRAEERKQAVRRDYEAARGAGELEEPVDATQLAKYLDKNRSSATNAGVLSTAEKELVRLGGATHDADGNLVPGTLKLNDMEELRKTIGVGGKKDATNSEFAGQLRKVIDASTEGSGGELYKAARKNYAEYAAEFKNQGVVRDLLGLKKNTSDRSVAFDNVFKRIVLSGDPEDLRTVRRSLLSAGDEGKQAFRELQGQAMKYLREETLSNTARDSNGRPIASADKYLKALKNLDRDGRLEDLVGKQGAQKMRDVGDLLTDIYTAPPGAVNTSNTGQVLIKYLADAGASGLVTGIPLPLIHAAKAGRDYLRTRKLRKQVGEALGDDVLPSKQAVKPFGVPEEPVKPGREPVASAADDSRLKEIAKLREAATGDAAKVLDGLAAKRHGELRAAEDAKTRAAQAAEFDRLAGLTDDPELRKALRSQAAAKREKIPVGTVKELDTTPTPAVEKPKKIPTGHATELAEPRSEVPTERLPTGEVREFPSGVEPAPERIPAPEAREVFVDKNRPHAEDTIIRGELPRGEATELREVPTQPVEIPKRLPAGEASEVVPTPDVIETPEHIPTGEAREYPSGVEPAPERIPQGEAREMYVSPERIARDEAKWRRQHGLNDETAQLAKRVAQAVDIDEAAVKRAVQRLNNDGPAFKAEIERIIESGGPRAQRPEVLKILRDAGGLDMKLAPDIGEKGFRANAGRMAGIFRRNGMGEDKLVERLHEEGYITQAEIDRGDGVRRALELVQAAARGEVVNPANRMGREAQSRAEQHAREEMLNEADRRGIQTHDRTVEQVEADLRADDERRWMDAHGLTPEQAETSKRVARAMEIDEAGVERAAVRYENDDAAFRAAIGQILGDVNESKPVPRSRKENAEVPAQRGAAERAAATPAEQGAARANGPDAAGARGAGDRPEGQAEGLTGARPLEGTAAPGRGRELRPGETEVIARTGTVEPAAVRSGLKALGPRAGNVTVSRLKIADKPVRTAEDAASVLAPMRRETQEHLLALVTDEAGKPLAVIRHSKGGRAETTVHLDSLVGAISQVAGGRKVWLAHNHPSGKALQSKADANMTQQFDSVMRGSGIEPQGGIVIAPGGRMSFDPGPRRDGAVSEQPIPAARRSADVPVTENRFVDRTPSKHPPISMPSELRELMAKELGDKPGVIFFDAQLRPAGVLELSMDEMAKLRTGDPSTGLMKLVRAASESGGSRMAINFPQGSTENFAAVKNLVRASNATHMPTVDVIAGGRSMVEGGWSPESAGVEFEQRGAESARQGAPREGVVGSAQALDKVLRDKFGSKLIEGLRREGLLHYESADAEGRPGQTKAVEIEGPAGGRAKLFFDRLTPEEAPRALMHEIGEHFGVVRLLGDQRYKTLLQDLKDLRKSGDEDVTAAFEHVERHYGGLSEATQLREVAARLVEAAPDQHLVRRLVNDIRAFFYQHFGTSLGNRVDADLLRGLAASALRKASAGELGRMRQFTYPDYMRGNIGPVQHSPLAAAGEDSTPELQRKYLGPIADRLKDAKRVGVSARDADEFLMALHAPERNRVIAARDPRTPDGGSGLTNAQARKIIGGFSPEQREQLDAVAKLVHALNRDKLDEMVKAGRIKAEVRDKLNKQYRYYVPLKARDEEDAVLGRRPKSGNNGMSLQ